MLEFSLCGRRKKGRGRGEGEKCDPPTFSPSSLFPTPLHICYAFQYTGHGLLNEIPRFLGIRWADGGGRNVPPQTPFPKA